jgi:sugar/nucleoside kinase (ribokinase family)
MSPVTSPAPLHYLVIGHVTHDLVPEGRRPGGTAVYAARTAAALGLPTGVLTRAGPEFDFTAALPGIAVQAIPAGQTTTFENRYGPGGRSQVLHASAGRIAANEVPAGWRRSEIVHLGPVAAEVDAGMLALFSNSLLGITPQGWFRRWGGNGQVYLEEWVPEADSISHAAVVILSEGDLPSAGALGRLRRLARLVVVTRADQGCTVYCQGEERSFPAPSVAEVDPTGAGDVFAAAFLIRLHQTRGNPWEAAGFANRLAAASVAHAGLPAKMDAIRSAALQPSEA